MPKFTPVELEDVLIVTCDVKDMYSNIEQGLGIKAVRYWLSKYPELLNQRFSVDFVIEALEFVLSNSTFQFNDKFYSLICGTVTGTKVAPSYANLTMAYLENKFYEVIKQIYGADIHNYVFQSWKRFLDDGQIMWHKSFGCVTEFVKILNSLDSKIQFTYECSDNELSYLNLLIYICNGKLMTDIFYKETDSHDFLPFNSCHPRHTKCNIPETLARTICTIVDDPDRKQYRLEELKTWLIKSGYPTNLIRSAFSKVQKVDQAILRDKVPSKSEELLVFVQGHNPINPQVFQKLSNCFNFLKTTEKFRELFGGTKLIKSERQPLNLGRLLQRSQFSSAILKKGCVKCRKSNCGTCSYLSEVDSVNFHRVNIVFKLMTHFTCSSGNIIYKITCKGCNEYYIGLTVNLRNRTSNHKFCVFNDASRIQKVHKHIYDCARAFSIPFTRVPFYKCKHDTNIA